MPTGTTQRVTLDANHWFVILSLKFPQDTARLVSPMNLDLHDRPTIGFVMVGNFRSSE